MSKISNIIKSEIYDINETNLGEKLKEHIGEIVNLLKILKYTDIKMITRIDEITSKRAVITTDVNELMKKVMEE